MKKSKTPMTYESTSKYRHMSSIEFIEKELGIELFFYQKILFQLTNFNHAIRHRAKIVKVAEPWLWYNNDRIVCKVWSCPYFDANEKAPTFVRIMFLSMDDFAMYRDFFGGLDEAWNEAMEVYDAVPEIIDNKWLEEKGFGRF